MERAAIALFVRFFLLYSQENEEGILLFQHYSLLF
jgi:hypothetical protein